MGIKKISFISFTHMPTVCKAEIQFYKYNSLTRYNSKEILQLLTRVNLADAYRGKPFTV